MVATLSADIVRSTSLKTEDLIELRHKLIKFIDDLGDDYPGFWGRIIRGDSIECFIPVCNHALRIAVLLKLFIKKFAGQCECSYYMKKHGIRFSIGMGEIHYMNKEEDIIDGPAIYISGRNLDEISYEDDSYSTIEVDGASYSFNSFLWSYVGMISSLVDSYSTKQAEVVFYKLSGYREREISKMLGISQSSVNTRSTGAQWEMLNTAIANFGHLNFGKICG